MIMPYIECPQCAHRALSVATRCPHCGFAFPPRPFHRPMAEPRLVWLRRSLVVGGLLAVGVVVVATLLGRAGSKPVPAPPVAAPVRMSPAIAAPAPDSGPRGLPAAGAKPAASAPPPAAPLVRAGVARYARTWTNVREKRSRGGASLRVLNPGEAVLVDSLRGGWYRVLADGRTFGYVHRSNLDAVPPPAGP